MRESFITADWFPAEPIGERIPAKYKSSMNPWVKQFLKLNDSKAKVILEERLGLAADWLQPLCNRLRSFDTFSVLCQGCGTFQRDYLGLGELAWADHFLPPMKQPELIHAKLNELGLSKIKGLAEFLTLFDGIQDAPPNCSGGFLPVKWWAPAKSNSEYSDLHDEVVGSWWDAVPILYGGNGDTLLLKRSGKVGWRCVAEQKVIPRLKGFANFIEVYADQGVPDFYSDPYAENNSH